jgi:hypothetical protein
VPILVDVDLEPRGAALVEARRPQPAELVRRAVDHELERLVAAELEQRSNGNGHTAPRSDPRTLADATKACTGPCRRTLPLSAFEKGRAKCRQCRHAEHRARQDRAAEAEPPRTDADG